MTELHISDLTPELRKKILRRARGKVERGHEIGHCFVEGDPQAANPDEGFCLRGALQKAAEDVGMNSDEAQMLSARAQISLGLDLQDETPCGFSDSEGKEGCLRVIDEALAA